MVTRALDPYVPCSALTSPIRRCAPGTRLADVFDRPRRALLILGAPGAGKTTLLLALTQDLLDRAAQDPSSPSPWSFRCRPGPSSGAR